MNSRWLPLVAIGVSLVAMVLSLYSIAVSRSEQAETRRLLQAIAGAVRLAPGADHSIGRPPPELETDDR